MAPLSSAPKVNTANGAGATSKVSGDGSVTIKTGVLSVTGGNFVNISAGYGGGSHDLQKASYGGLTSVSAKTGVNITATAFTATSSSIRSSCAVKVVPVAMTPAWTLTVPAPRRS